MEIYVSVREKRTPTPSAAFEKLRNRNDWGGPTTKSRFWGRGLGWEAATKQGGWHLFERRTFLLARWKCFTHACIKTLIGDLEGKMDSSLLLVTPGITVVLHTPILKTNGICSSPATKHGAGAKGGSSTLLHEFLKHKVGNHGLRLLFGSSEKES